MYKKKKEFLTLIISNLTHKKKQLGDYELQHCFRTLSVLTVGLTLIVSTLLGRIVASSSLGSRSCFWDTIR